MIRYALFAAVLLALLWVAEPAKAHGPIHGYVSPAYDCYEDIEGDLSVTYDWDKKEFAKFRCVCIWTEMGYRVCYWRLISVRKNLENMRIPSRTKHYGQARIVRRRVSWQAWHGGNGCVQHHARKPVIYVRHK